jgi:hypothetical protein
MPARQERLFLPIPSHDRKRLRDAARWRSVILLALSTLSISVRCYLLMSFVASGLCAQAQTMYPNRRQNSAEQCPYSVGEKVEAVYILFGFCDEERP